MQKSEYQQNLFQHYNLGEPKLRRCFGGKQHPARGRKLTRPFLRNAWTHLVLKSSQAKGMSSMLNLKFRSKIDQFIRRQAQKHLIAIDRGVNMGNHFHLLIRYKSRDCYRKFIRAITGYIARLIQGMRQKESSHGGRPCVEKVKFWDYLPYTRLLTTQFEFEDLFYAYLPANQIERDFGKVAREEFLQRARNEMQRLRCRNLRTESS